MSLPCSLLRNLCSSGCVVVLAAGLSHAQTAVSATTADTAGWSSSKSVEIATAAPASAALPSSPSASSGASAAQDNNGYSGWGGHSLLSRLTFEAGGGFNAPVGNDIPYITWGGNFTVGAGVRFSKRVSGLLEYQFMDDKLPGAFISAEGVDAGNSYINSITGSPVVYLFPQKSNGVYLVGGFGYYHKSTNFNDYECCAVSYYGEYYVPVTVASITSNQWGANGGLGVYHRLGGMYGDGKSELFAEARYTYIHTPPITQANGLGTTGLLPVTFGIRF